MPSLLEALPRAMARIAIARQVRAGTVLPARARVHFVDGVASTSPPDVVDGSCILRHAPLLRELLVEAENGALLLAVHIACAASTSHEVGICGRWVESDARGRSGGIGTGSDILRIDFGDVACAASAGVVPVGCRN